MTTITTVQLHSNRFTVPSSRCCITSKLLISTLMGSLTHSLEKRSRSVLYVNLDIAGCVFHSHVVSRKNGSIQYLPTVLDVCQSRRSTNFGSMCLFSWLFIGHEHYMCVMVCLSAVRVERNGRFPGYLVDQSCRVIFGISKSGYLEEIMYKVNPQPVSCSSAHQLRAPFPSLHFWCYFCEKLRDSTCMQCMNPLVAYELICEKSSVRKPKCSLNVTASPSFPTRE